MTIDITTLLIVFAMNCVAIAAIFLGAWRQGGGLVLLRVGGAAGLLAVGVVLFLLRERVPDWISITLANTVMLSGVGLAWAGVRAFEERTAPPWFTFAGAAVWLAVSPLAAFALPAPRIVLTSLVMAAYAFACARELSRPRPVMLKARRPLAVLLYIHAAILVVRGLCVLLVQPENVFAVHGLLGLLLAEPAVIVLALSLLGVALAREHAEHELRQAAATDDLTGVLNRRALLAGAGAAVGEARRSGRPAALLLFDLDHFKSINDRFGHSIGDQTLRGFARIVSRAIRDTDVFGRVGGEEFAAFLPGADEATARRIAERIRADFAGTLLAPGWPPPTVSVGVAAADAESEADLDQLLIQADRALYEAKRGGRDRVVGPVSLAG